MKKDAKNNEKNDYFVGNYAKNRNYKRNVAENCFNAGKSYCFGL